MKHLVLIDGHHLMYRAFWAIPRTLKTNAGELTNVTFGMASMTLSILQQEQPDALLFCFDAGEETFRHQENKTYKEGRAETPDEFYAQIPRVMEFLETSGFRHVSDGKYEADDFLCSYAQAGTAAGMRVTIVTGDRDAFQLASDTVRVSIPHKGYQAAEYLGPAEIFAKYGIRPDQVACYKGLCGDSSDNLPGVNGIGPKTAAKLLQDYGTLEGIYGHIGDIKGSTREKLERDREQAFFCKRMAVLVCDIPLPVSLDDLAVRDLPADRILSFFDQLQFTLLERRLRRLCESEYGQRAFRSPQASAAAPAAVEKPADDSQLALF